MEYSLSNGILKVVFSSLGGEMISVKKNGKERLWQNDNGTWSGHAPILFPYPGRCLFDYEGKDYPMNQHGFARRSEFALSYIKENEIEFVLTSNEETLKIYPFEFALRITYSLENESIKVKYTFENPANRPLVYSFGSHESYALENEISQYEVRFEEEEHLYSLEHDQNGHLTGEGYELGRSKAFDLGSPLLKNAHTVIFKGIKSRRISLFKKGGKEVASLAFEGCSNVLFWHPTGSQMVCMEPWMSLGDEVIKKTDFRDKEGVRELAPKGKESFIHVITYK